MGKTTVLSQCLSALKRYEMISAGDAVLCGFSGGADSVTLLSLLFELSEGTHGIPPFSLYACHVHHGIRGKEADRDEAFCRAFCEDRNIPYFSLFADVPKLASETGDSLETAGRKVRYQFFRETAERVLKQRPELTGVKIATAHTASDNAETVLFHLARGTSLSGLTGIPPVRENIIRPLIDVTREEVEAYCEEEGLQYMTDASNEELSYSRNRIRHEVLPALVKINSETVRHIAKTSQTLRRDSECFDAMQESLLKRAKLSEGTYSVPELASAPDAVLIRTLCKEMWDFAGVCPETHHLEETLQWIRAGEKFKQIQIPGGVYVTLAGEQLLFHWPRDPEDPAPRIFRRTVTMEDRLEYVSSDPTPVTVRLMRHRGTPGEFGALQLENSLEYDKIDFNFILRTRNPGDTFRPKGRGVRKKMKTLYQEAGIPAEARGDLILLEQGGEIAWLEGFGAAEGFAAGRETPMFWTVEVLR